MNSFVGRVVVCFPQSRRLVAQIQAHLAPSKRFRPSIEHSPSTCDSCQIAIWVGRAQLEILKSPLIRMHKLCWTCTFEVTAALGLKFQEIVTDVDAHLAPRRT